MQKPPPKKIHLDDEDDDSSLLTSRKKSTDTTPAKKLKSGSGRGIPLKSPDLEESDKDDDKDAVSPLKSGGRGRGGRGALAQSSSGRGRGGGRGGFMNFGERKDPPHKGEKVHSYYKRKDLSIENIYQLKISCLHYDIETIFVCQEVPEGAPDCLAGLTFVISGTLDRYFIFICCLDFRIFLYLHMQNLHCHFFISSSFFCWDH